MESKPITSRYRPNPLGIALSAFQACLLLCIITYGLHGVCSLVFIEQAWIVDELLVNYTIPAILDISLTIANINGPGSTPGKLLPYRLDTTNISFSSAQHLP
ncbi:hypothetical protein PSACC_01086 [Paramicrosporidium saccamoebae]|uniref:Uncharacterized protein n=1 Tax=Paramicrosporidium saccamoebae TaxID=1246581 RepID=A0A2H9TMY4_9FUNG|nr:hypothetical protein PSACC_01086 [Paramicrosporidium saccamoebae]